MCKRAWPTTRVISLPVPKCGTPLSYVTQMPLHQGSKKLSRGKAFRVSRAAPRLRLPKIQDLRVRYAFSMRPEAHDLSHLHTCIHLYYMIVDILSYFEEVMM
jgi:hypothetical protein